MSSQTLVAALLILAACSKDNGDSNPGSTDDSSTGDDSGSGDDSAGSKVDADKDGYDSTEDCDDTDAAVNPGATEVCDGIDNDCVGGADDGVTTDYFMDGDADGHGAGKAMPACEAPKGYVDSSDDCDDSTAAAYPGATEVCDGIDNNCDKATDEGLTSPFYMDGDGDGYGAGKVMDACSATSGYVDNADDCDDLDIATHPGASEVCDKIDNDCDTDVDDDDSGVTGTSTWWPDYDGDGYGDMYGGHRTVTACDMPTGYVADNTDCNDYDSTWWAYVTKYYDQDLDGYGDWSTDVCWTSDYYAKVGGDCDNNDASINPGMTEICNDVDDDCDTYIDGDDKSIVYTTWYSDADEDGYGDDSTATDTCDPTDGWVTAGGDCDDTEYLMTPGRSEYCDGVDNNCDGTADETTDYVDWYRDDDGDHYGQDGDVINDCAPQKGYDPTGGDCDDANADVNPDAEEVCGDDVDNQCDGFVDNCAYDIDDAAFSLSGNTGSNYAGFSVAGGDLNGDGTDDLIVGAPYANSYSGGAYVVNGPATGAITVADVDVTITGSYDYVGTDVTSRDVNSDGYDDLLAAGSYTNKVFLFMGPLSSAIATSSADVTFTTATYGQFGDAIALADLDGDADLDTAIGEPYDYSTSDYGNVYIYFGARSGSVTSADLVVMGTVAYSYGGKVANVGDNDADGLDDLAQAAFYGGSSYQGEVNLLDDPASSTGTVTASSIAAATMTGENNGDNFGYRMAGGDYNNDGYDDVFVAATNYMDSVTFTYGLGRVYGFLGPVSGSYSASSADVIVTGELMYGQLGQALALGDVQGDAADEVVIGRPYGDTYVGAAYLLSGPTTGSIDLASMASIGDPDGVESSAYVGCSVGTIRDWSGDGANDVIIGAFGMTDNPKYWGEGRTWVISSENL